jgi:hypothetical protein
MIGANRQATLARGVILIEVLRACNPLARFLLFT